MIQIKMPEAGFSITEGTVVEWYKEVGDAVDTGENVVCVETDKLTVDIPAERGGTLNEVRYKAGEVVAVGDVMAIIAEGDEKSPEAADVSVAPASSVSREETGREDATLQLREKPRPGEGRRISPAAKAVARSRGIDLALITEGSGPHGRIVKEDVLGFIARQGPKVEEPAGSAAGRAAVKQPEGVGPGQRVEFKGWRKVIADRMLASKTEIPHYTMSVEADVTELSHLIERIREVKDNKITYLPFMMKALEYGIREVPAVNAYCDGKGFSVLEQINMGIAIDLGEKLLVPVIKDVGSKSVLDLVDALGSLIAKTREEKLEPPDVEGGTITLTNVGMFQIHSATSVILQPQVAIVYMGTARDAPGVSDGKIGVRKKMIFGSTFDHRVVNGASGGRFLMKVKEYLEDMGRFVLDVG
jgi:pyruvate/2-oxoglutarate dehydrogenase complex dihydrolipoamide acyltransferase (E2) component